MRELVVASVLLAWCPLVAGRALAQPAADVATHADEARMLVSVSAGAALALTSLAVGGAVLATHESNAERKVGAYTMLSGVALAPIVSHAFAGEWDRAALFGVVPVAAAAGAMIMIESAPVLEGHGVLGQRRVLTLCTCAALLSALVGLYDSMHAAQRARADALAIAPWFERDGVGAWVGGAL